MQARTIELVFDADGNRLDCQHIGKFKDNLKTLNTSSAYLFWCNQTIWRHYFCFAAGA